MTTTAGPRRERVSPVTATAGRRLAFVLLVIVVVDLGLVLLGALLPGAGWLGVLGARATTSYAPHLAVIALLAAVGAGILAARTRSPGPVVVLGLALVVLVAGVVPVAAQVRAVEAQGAEVRWGPALALAGDGLFPSRPPETVVYATLEGRPLRADVYRPPAGVRARRVPVVQVHGGGFAGGVRSQPAVLDHALARAGYTVVDVDYRLRPTPTYTRAPADVACAAAWVGAHGPDLGVDPDQLVLSGESAGGALALLTSYRAAGGVAVSSCGGTVPVPRAVLAAYPGVDKAGRWYVDGPLQALGRSFTRNFLGGSPTEVPDRYAADDPIALVRPGLPPTQVVVGAEDHLVGAAPSERFVGALTAARVPAGLVEIPYADHAVEQLAPGGLPAQALAAASVRFLVTAVPGRP